jgi:hypothetical protein
MFKNVNDFPNSVQLAAIQYVSAYLQNNMMCGSHSHMMQTLGNSPDLMCRQLAECIDVLLFQHKQEVSSGEYQLGTPSLDLRRKFLGLNPPNNLRRLNHGSHVCD